jgi:uncharacterized damage-inducible protein DinB
MLAVEWLWLERWRGNAPMGLIPVEEFPSLAAVVERWKSVELEMRRYVASLDEAALTLPRTYVGTQGEPRTYPLWRMIAHTLNHQSYHRGQASTQLRLLGAQPPRVDFLVGRDVDFRS